MYAILFKHKSFKIKEENDIYELDMDCYPVGVVCPLCNLLISKQDHIFETDDYTSLNLVINCKCGSFVCCPTTKDDVSLYNVFTSNTDLNSCSKLIDINDAEKINRDIKSIIVNYHKIYDPDSESESEDSESESDFEEFKKITDSEIIDKYKIYKIAICNILTYGYPNVTDKYMERNKSLCYEYDDFKCIDVNMNIRLFYKTIKFDRSKGFVYYKSVCEKCNRHYEGELGGD